MGSCGERQGTVKDEVVERKMQWKERQPDKAQTDLFLHEFPNVAILWTFLGMIFYWGLVGGEW